MATLSQNTKSTAVKATNSTDKSANSKLEDSKSTANKSPEKFDNSKNTAVEYIATIGESTYKLSRGEILVSPIAPEVRCSTRKFSQVRFVVADPTSELFAKFRKEAEVKVSIGFPGGKIVEKFKGKIKNVGRVEPIGTIIIAIDNLATLGNTAAATTTDPAAVPPTDGRKTEVDRSKRKVSRTLNYAKLEKSKLVKAAKLSDGTAYDPAAVLVFSTAIPPKSTVTISIPGGTDFVDAIVAPGSGGATNTLVLSEGAYAKASILPNKDKKAYKLEIYTEAPVEAKTKTASTTEKTVLENTKLKYSKQTPYAPNKDGSSTLQQTAGQKIVKDANLVGNVVVAKGNTIVEVSADDKNKTKSALVLDYKFGKSAFFGEPILTIKTPLVVNSGVGTLTVSGWNTNSKEAIVATAATPPSDGTTPAVKVFASPKGALKIGDLIYPGSKYTWGDATKNGTRPPETEEIYQGIIRIAQIITQYTEKVGKGKWQINSWYRNPAANRAAGSSSGSRHLRGDAVDFAFPGMGEFYTKLAAEWGGGVAIKTGAFIHIDDRGSKSRWTYP